MSFDEEQWRKQWRQPKPPWPTVASVKAAIEEIRRAEDLRPVVLIVPDRTMRDLELELEKLRRDEKEPPK